MRVTCSSRSGVCKRDMTPHQDPPRLRQLCGGHARHKITRTRGVQTKSRLGRATDATASNRRENYGDHAGPHAPRRRRRRSGPRGHQDRRAGSAAVPGLVRRGPAWCGPGPHPRHPWPGPVLPQGPGRPRSRTTTPGRQQSRPAPARRAWPPGGSPQRESRYPGGPCAARESGAPTTPWAPWRARSTPSWRAPQLSRPDLEHRRRRTLIWCRRTVLSSSQPRPAASSSPVPPTGHDRLPGDTRLRVRSCHAAALADDAGPAPAALDQCPAMAYSFAVRRQ